MSKKCRRSSHGSERALVMVAFVGRAYYPVCIWFIIIYGVFMNKIHFLIFSVIIAFTGTVFPVVDPAKEAIAKNKNVIVLFMRSTCQYCHYLQPIMNIALAPYRNSITYVVVEVSAMPDYYKKIYKFSTVPTVFYYKNGIVQASHGSNNKTVTQDDIQGYIKRIYRL